MTSSTPGEAEVSSDELLLRWIRRVPQQIVVDSVTGETKPHVAALQFDPDGMSVYVDSIRERVRVQRLGMCDWNRYHAIEFPCSAVPRRLARVVLHFGDYEFEPRLNEAHALVQGLDKPRPAKDIRGEIRDSILDHYAWVEADPNCPSRPTP